MREDKKLVVCNDELLDVEGKSRLLPNDIKGKINSTINEEIRKDIKCSIQK